MTDITFEGPGPSDIFLGIVQRGAAMIMRKDDDEGLRGFELGDVAAAFAGSGAWTDGRADGRR